MIKPYPGALDAVTARSVRVIYNFLGKLTEGWTNLHRRVEICTEGWKLMLRCQGKPLCIWCDCHWKL
jgi:hypothetical protein